MSVSSDARMASSDFAVIGGGIAGLAIAYELATFTWIERLGATRIAATRVLGSNRLLTLKGLLNN